MKYTISSTESYITWQPTPFTGLSDQTECSASGNCLTNFDGKYFANHHFIPLLDIGFKPWPAYWNIFPCCCDIKNNPNGVFITPLRLSHEPYSFDISALAIFWNGWLNKPPSPIVSLVSNCVFNVSSPWNIWGDR